ncbi:MAG: hypothetical protein E7478_00445 [Ruminococcaceae bacterium]|nr:hypothetical protein [Oscillospiraceae bacterium]
MKQIVEFELLSDVMCGGVRTVDNFLESEQFVRGSVLRAAFANEILLECPLADVPSKSGRLNFVEVKDADGKCSGCAYRKICESFSDMTFSDAYKNGAFPAPFTARVCKKHGTAHRIKDTIYQNGAIACDDCDGSVRRMESLKGFIRLEGAQKAVREKPDMSMSTHTAISYHTDTAKDGSLFSVNAIRKGQRFTAVIDDCDSGMISVGTVIYAGKYSSNGFGKMRVISLSPFAEITADEIKKRITAFNKRFGTSDMAAVLLMSDACISADNDSSVLSDELYNSRWEKALFGEGDIPFGIEKIFAQTQLYSGFDTSKKWNDWKSTQPDLLALKGTSVLLKIKPDRLDEAAELLAEMQNNGIGRKCDDGYGRIEICHDIHLVGVN